MHAPSLEVRTSQWLYDLSVLPAQSWQLVRSLASGSSSTRSKQHSGEAQLSHWLCVLWRSFLSLCGKLAAKITVFMTSCRQWPVAGGIIFNNLCLWTCYLKKTMREYLQILYKRSFGLKTDLIWMVKGQDHWPSLYPCECVCLKNTSREFFQIWHKCSLRLTD